MSLSAGSRLGPYEIVGAIGAGGMGEVWRAKDTRLDRTVAIKVLPPHLASDPELRARFEREARVISGLKHPNICVLHDIGHQDGVDYLVMEYLEGETLADRLAKGPLPLAQALAIGAEVAGALDRAHRASVVHRDLKPGNVILTRDGAKLLDFGLAKASAAAKNPAAAALTTELKPLTERGALLGTVQYMAPEQLEGGDVDARTDIFALGAVLYEMVTGRRAFSGASQASLIGAILRDEPRPIAELQPLSPPALERVVRACLAKDPDERWQSARDVKRELAWIAQEGSHPGADAPRPTSRRRTGRLMLAGLTLVALVIGGAIGALLYQRTGMRRPPTLWFTVQPPRGCSLGAYPNLTVSPDGTRLAFVGAGGDGKPQIWVRPLGSLETRALAGTEGAGSPFWSPDSSTLGFFAGGKLRKVDVGSGVVQIIADAPSGRGGTWGLAGDILFSPYIAEAIYRVSSSGGAVTPVTELDPARGDVSHRWPRFLPDGVRFLFYVQAARAQDTGVYVGSLKAKSARLLLRSVAIAAYAPPGLLLFVRDGDLMAQRLDPSRMELQGEARPIVEGIAVNRTYGFAEFAVSETGILAYRTNDDRPSQLTWLDRNGRTIGTVGEPDLLVSPRLSPDGRKIAVVRLDPRTRDGDIWLADVASGVMTRFTFQPGAYVFPAWSPDGRQVAFAFTSESVADLYIKQIGTADGSGDGVSLGTFAVPSDWSPDRSSLLFMKVVPRTGFDLWLLPTEGGGRPRPFLATPFYETYGKFSPDGKWVAYTSDLSGRMEIHVRPFPGPGQEIPVSSGGGIFPFWSRTGKELFYISTDHRLMSVPVRSLSPFVAGSPQPLFELPPQQTSFGFAECDVAPDGQRFLISALVGAQSAQPISVAVNWASEGVRP